MTEWVLYLTSHQQLRSYRDWATASNLIGQTVGARYRTPDPRVQGEKGLLLFFTSLSTIFQQCPTVRTGFPGSSQNYYAADKVSSSRSQGWWFIHFTAATPHQTNWKYPSVYKVFLCQKRFTSVWYWSLGLKLFVAFLGINQFCRAGLRFVCWFYVRNSQRLMESGFM